MSSTSWRSRASSPVVSLLRSRASLLIAGWLAVALAASPATGQAPERLVVFGDSLSDPGNHFIAFGQTSRAPFGPIPDFPYAIGGHHLGGA